MVEQNSAGLHYAAQRHMAPDMESPSVRGEYGTLILDRCGKIRSSGAAVESLFDRSHAELSGMRISKLVPGLFPDPGSPSFPARYLPHLCAAGEWREFEAQDAHGQGFAVLVRLSHMVTDGEEILVLNYRRQSAPAVRGKSNGKTRRAASACPRTSPIFTWRPRRPARRARI